MPNSVPIWPRIVAAHAGVVCLLWGAVVAFPPVANASLGAVFFGAIVVVIMVIGMVDILRRRSIRGSVLCLLATSPLALSAFPVLGVGLAHVMEAVEGKGHIDQAVINLVPIVLAHAPSTSLWIHLLVFLIAKIMQTRQPATRSAYR